MARPCSDRTLQSDNASEAVNSVPVHVAVTLAFNCSSASPALKIDRSIGFSPSCKTLSLCSGDRPAMTADNVTQRQLRMSVAIGIRYQSNSCNCGGLYHVHSLTNLATHYVSCPKSKNLVSGGLG